MDLTRKLQKVFSPDGLRSAVEHVRRWSHPVPVGPMLRALDAEKLARLQHRYQRTEAAGEVGNSAKFADAEYWLKINVERAQDLSLDRQQSQTILDLGCGAGYFLYVCQRLGHEALGLDIDENPLFRETIALLGVSRQAARIEAHTPLPPLGKRFDLVTAHCICFQKLPSPAGERREWDAAAWSAFLDDVRTNVLNPSGQLLLDFNPRGGGIFYPSDVERLFRKRGARIFRSKVLFEAL